MPIYAHSMDDFEPINDGERCDFVYGHYHIGREDESRAELALLFDPRWLPDPSFLTAGSWDIINAGGGRLFGLSTYESSEYSDDQLEHLRLTTVGSTSSFKVVANAPLSVAVVELARPTIFSVEASLRVYSAYVGYADISWPSKFRTVINAGIEYL